MSDDQRRSEDYVATTRLTTRDGEVLAEVGETCERVPPQSLWWLVRDGLIVPRADNEEGR